jgi:hypothetical protein
MNTMQHQQQNFLLRVQTSTNPWGGPGKLNVQDPSYAACLGSYNSEKGDA